MKGPILSTHERRLLAILADVIAPRWGAMPSASDIDLTAAPLDRALKARPDLIAPLQQLLGEIDLSRPAAAIADLQSARPSQFNILMQAVAGAYYMDATVRAALRYPGQQRLPVVE